MQDGGGWSPRGQGRVLSVIRSHKGQRRVLTVLEGDE